MFTWQRQVRRRWRDFGCYGTTHPRLSSLQELLVGDPGCADRDVSDACSVAGGRRALRAIIRMLAKVGRSFAVLIRA